MSEANLLKFPVVFATVFTQEIFSNFCRNALKSPNISWVGGNSLWLDADIFTSLIISLQILGAPYSLSGHPSRVRGVRPGSHTGVCTGPGLQSDGTTVVETASTPGGRKTFFAFPDELDHLNFKQ